jgi:gliding motility-associated lipoprotein GldD
MNRFKIPNFKFQIKEVVMIFCLLPIAYCLSSCGSNDDDAIIPKPHAYFRLQFPADKKYVEFDSLYPFKFEMPSYTKIEYRKGPNDETAWLNWNFPSFNATVNLTYKTINGSIQDNLNETYTYVNKHQIKASSIEDHLVSRDSSKVYGLIYEIGGNAASSIQFFLTDSTKHFIRGALYFNAAPNSDSIAPVLEYVRKDIYHMIDTFEWKNDVSASVSLTESVDKKQRRSK